MYGSVLNFMFYIEDGKCPGCGATLNRILLHAGGGTNITPYIEVWHVDATQAPCLYPLNPREHGLAVLSGDGVTYHH